MLRIAVCDDEEKFLSVFSNSIEELIEKNGYDMTLSSYSNVSLFLNEHESSAFDIVFLDIEMPELGGFQCVELLRKFNEDVIIIFVSNHESYVFHSFVFRPFRFIRKSRFYDELEEALDSSAAHYYEKNRVYNVASEVGMVSVNLTDIRYFDVYSHNVFMHMKDKKLLVKRSLKEVEDELASLGFIRIHKSYLVSFRYIYFIQTNSITLVNMEKLPMSKHRAKDVKEKMIYFTKRFED